MTIDEAKDYINAELASYLDSTGRSSSKHFCCVNPEHNERTASMKYDPKQNKCHCFGCGVNYDGVDLIGLDYGLENFIDKVKKGAEIYGLPIDNEYGKNRPAIKPKRIQKPVEVKQPHQTDFTEYFLQANAHIGETTYHRGISENTLTRFKIGYDPSWKHPKHSKDTPSPRLIIPVTKHSYLARYVGNGSFVDGYGNTMNKGKVKGADSVSWTFNLNALSKATQPIFIVEGEIDAMSIVDVGGEAVAIGSTANSKRFLSDLNMVASKHPITQPLIIALDNDNAGERAVPEISQGLKAQGIRYGIAPAGWLGSHKDANELLMADREALRESIRKVVNGVDGLMTEANKEETERLKLEREAIEKESALYSLNGFIESVKTRNRVEITPTGFNGLDTLLDGGLYPGLYVVGAISSLGKTTFALQIADNVAQQGRDVLIFSLEMDRNELIAKSLSRWTYFLTKDQYGKKYAKTTRGMQNGIDWDRASEGEKKAVKDAYDSYREYAPHIYITEGVGDVGIKEIREKVKHHTEVMGKPPVVLIDYIQIIAPSDPRSSDKQNTDKAILELKRMSRDYKIPVIGISSFNRQSYTDPVNMAAFKESGSVEYSSDVLLGLQYSGMDFEGDESETARTKRVRGLMQDVMDTGSAGDAQRIQLKVLKNRNGRKGDVDLSFCPMFNYFEDYCAGQGELGVDTVTQQAEKPSQQDELEKAYMDIADKDGIAKVKKIADKMGISEKLVRSLVEKNSTLMLGEGGKTVSRDIHQQFMEMDDSNPLDEIPWDN